MPEAAHAEDVIISETQDLEGEANVVEIDTIVPAEEPAVVVRKVSAMEETTVPAEVIEIRPVAEPEAEIDSTPSTIPPPRKPSVPPNEETPLDELDELQAELDALLSQEITDDNVEEHLTAIDKTQQSIHRLELKLNKVDRLPDDLDPEIGESSAAKPAPSLPARPVPPAFTGRPDIPETASMSWGEPRAGVGAGKERPEGDAEVLRALESVPLIGRFLVRDGRWRLSALFFPTFGSICVVVYYLAVTLMQGSADPLRSVAGGEEKQSRATAIPTEEIREVLLGYARAPDWETKLKYIRAPGHLVPVVREYYQKHPIVPAEDVRLGMAQPVTLNGLEILKLEATLLPSGQLFEAMLERDPHGHLKVDWEVAVDYQEIDWNQFAAEQRTDPVQLRVVAREEDYYNFQYSDDSVYRCYRLWYPHSEWPTFYGYVKRDGEIDRQMQEHITLSGDGRYAFILSLAYAEETPKEAPLVEIREVVCPSWVIDYEARAKGRGAS